MTVHVVVAVVLLAVPALVPTVACVGVRPVTLFLVPLAGSVLVAVAAELELAVGGSLLMWFVILAVVANLMAARRLRRGAGPSRDSLSSPWPWITLLVVVAAVVWPLHALRNPIVLTDGYAIWTLHSIFIYGGHDTFLSGLKNPVTTFSNPGYPPLVPASGALAFIGEGRVDIRLAVIVTGVLEACGLGVVACGIAEVARRQVSAVTRGASLVVAAALCLVGFGSGIAGLSAVGGSADLTWAAAGVAAVVYGLVLPRSPRHLAIAWLCATVASLTKNEGFVTALFIFLLIAVRHRSTLVGLVRSGPFGSGRRAAAVVGEPEPDPTPSKVVRLLFVIGSTVVMAAPGLAWVLLMRLEGIGSDFVGHSTETFAQRAHPTLAAFADHLHILPVAAAVAVVGSLVLRGTRTRLGLGHPGWLWLVIAWSLAAIAATYVFGALEIKWWLATSIVRTMIFAQLALYTDLAVWCVVALTRTPRPEETTPRYRHSARTGAPVPTEPDRQLSARH